MLLFDHILKVDTQVHLNTVKALHCKSLILAPQKLGFLHHKYMSILLILRQEDKIVL